MISAIAVRVWAASTVDMAVGVGMLFIGMLVDLETIVVSAIEIVVKCVLTAAYSIDVLPGVAVDIFTDTLSGVLSAVLSRSGVKVLADVNSTTFVGAITLLRFPV